MKPTDIFKLGAGLLGLQSSSSTNNVPAHRLSSDQCVLHGTFYSAMPPQSFLEPISAAELQDISEKVKEVTLSVYHNRDKAFPPQYYPVNSGLPFGFHIENPEDVSTYKGYPFNLCENPSPLSETYREMQKVMIEAFNEDSELKKRALKVQTEPLTLPSDFHNPHNVTVSAIDIPNIQRTIVAMECDHIFSDGNPIAAHKNVNASHAAVFFLSNYSDITPAIMTHEMIGHETSRDHPVRHIHGTCDSLVDQYFWEKNCESAVEKAIKHTTCRPIGMHSTILFTPMHCDQKPEDFTTEDAKHLSEDPRFLKLGIWDDMLYKCAFNPEKALDHVNEAIRSVSMASVLEYRVIKAQEKYGPRESEAESRLPDIKVISGLMGAIAIVIGGAAALKKYAKNPEQRRVFEVLEEQQQRALQQQPTVTPHSPPLTIGSFVQDVASLVAKDLVKQYQNVQITTPKLQIAAPTPWKADSNWDKEAQKISELITDAKVIPLTVNDGHRFSSDGEDICIFIGTNKKTGTMYGAKYDDQSQYPQVYAVPSALQVNAPPNLTPGDVMNFSVGSQWQRDPDVQEEGRRIAARITSGDITPQPLTKPRVFSNGTPINDSSHSGKMLVGIYEGAKYRFPQVYSVPPNLRKNAPTTLAANTVVNFKADYINRGEKIVETAKDIGGKLVKGFKRK